MCCISHPLKMERHSIQFPPNSGAIVWATRWCCRPQYSRSVSERSGRPEPLQFRTAVRKDHFSQIDRCSVLNLGSDVRMVPSSRFECLQSGAEVDPKYSMLCGCGWERHGRDAILQQHMKEAPSRRAVIRHMKERIIRSCYRRTLIVPTTEALPQRLTDDQIHFTRITIVMIARV
jgi:hypothetical protein